MEVDSNRESRGVRGNQRLGEQWRERHNQFRKYLRHAMVLGQATVAVTSLDVFDDVAVAVQTREYSQLVTLLVNLPQPFRRLLKVSAPLFSDF